MTAAAPDDAARELFRAAGATWLIEGPAPGPDWLEDAYFIAGQTPPLG